MNVEDYNKNKEIRDKLLCFREQALCIKINIQILRELWKLRDYFKEKNAGAFYKVSQENYIFRIVLETYKLLYDQTSGNTIFDMAASVYNQMEKMGLFDQKKLKKKYKDFKSKLQKYQELKQIISNIRNEVYAHNDPRFHWYSIEYTKVCVLDDHIYEYIFEIADECIEYCNDLFKELRYKQLFNEKQIYYYSNYDDIKKLFGLETEKDELSKLLYRNKKD